MARILVAGVAVTKEQRGERRQQSGKPHWGREKNEARDEGNRVFTRTRKRCLGHDVKGMGRMITK